MSLMLDNLSARGPSITDTVRSYMFVSGVNREIEFVIGLGLGHIKPLNMSVQEIDVTF